MKTYKFYKIIIVVTLVLTGMVDISNGQDIREISLDGEWKGKHFDYGMGTWKPAWGIFMAFPPPEADKLEEEALIVKVPGSIQQSLVDQKKVKDPYIGDNAKDIRWVEDQEWWLVKSVDIPENWEGKSINLKCNMINYQADVWVNQTWVGRTIGNYLPMDIIVDKQLNYGSHNDIVMRLRAPENSTNYIKNNLFIDWRIRDKEVLHERPWVVPSNPQAGEYLISKCFFGWDWGPHIVPVGILQPIKLEAREAQTIESVFVKTNSVANGKASLDIDFELENITSSNSIVGLEYSIVSKQSGLEVKSDELEVRIEAKGNANKKVVLSIDNPELWWPNNYGPQNLYVIKTKITKDGKVLDTTEDQFGIRTVVKVKNEDPNWLDGINFRHDPDPELADGQYNWTFEVNGVKTFIQGMNFIPVDAMLDLSPELYNYTLRSAADANVNMLRVWGEGLYETDDFYNKCDELGIMVWQDFWVGSYSPAQPQEKSWEAVVANLKRTRNHPSLVMYCGGNEFDATRKDRLEQITKLAELIETYDGTRAFHKASPHGGSVHGGMGIAPKEKRNLMYGRFSAEAGYQQSWPPKSDMVKFLREDQLFPLEKNVDILSKHNAMVASIPDVTHKVYGAPQNVDELIRAEMLHNVIGWQAQIENMRLERYKVSGCLFWALNDVWPTTSWSMINWYGTRKNHYYAFKKGTAPLQVTASQQHQVLIPGEAYDLDICLINDHLKRFNDLNIEASIYLGQKAEKVYSKSFKGSIDENSVACLGKLDWIIPNKTTEHNFLLVLKTMDKKGNLLARNEYTCLIGATEEVEGDEQRVSTSGGFFGEYRKWTKNEIMPKLVGFPKSLKPGEEKSFEIHYKNKTDNALMGLETLITNLPTGVRLYLDDNYVHLLPGEKRVIKASIENTLRSKLNENFKLNLQIDGWNVETKSQKLDTKFGE